MGRTVSREQEGCPASSRADPDQAAVEAVKPFFDENRERVVFSRQVEVLLEGDWFHWITNRALRELAGEVRSEGIAGSYPQGGTSTCIGIGAIAVEVKNTLGYMDREEIETKIALCDAIGVTPVFVARMLPRSWILDVMEAGGVRWHEKRLRTT